MDRQICSLYYERLLSSRDKLPVAKEAKERTKSLAEGQRDFIKDPDVLEFLDLKANSKHTESQLETAIIDKLQEFLLELGKTLEIKKERVSIEIENKAK